MNYVQECPIESLCVTLFCLKPLVPGITGVIGRTCIVSNRPLATGQYCVTHESLVNLRFVGNKKKKRALLPDLPLPSERPRPPAPFPPPSLPPPHSHRTRTADGEPPARKSLSDTHNLAEVHFYEKIDGFPNHHVFLSKPHHKGGFRSTSIYKYS